MNHHFDVRNEKIKGRPDLKLYSGNIDTYTFSFDFDENWQGLIKFATFNSGTDTYIVEINDNIVTVPHEILSSVGVCSFGIFATNAQDNIKRISSEILEFEISQGAYQEGLSPDTPTPEIWEELFGKSVPRIKDGYWYLYDIYTGDYKNTDIKTTPQKGVDYFTQEDKTILVNEVEERAIGDIEIALDKIIAIQNELIGGESA